MMKIKQMPLDARPRERLKNVGVENLSQEELLAIILRSGTKNISVKELSLEVLKLINEIYNVDNLTLSLLMTIKGMGETKAMSILAALELGKRVYLKSDCKIEKITNGEDIYHLFHYLYKLEKQENLIVLLLDTKMQIINHKTIFKGSINMSVASPLEIFQFAILNNASNIIVIHNHPSGDPTPSNYDVSFTKQIIKCGDILGIKVIDHIIIGNNKYYTFRNNEVIEVEKNN